MDFNRRVLAIAAMLNAVPPEVLAAALSVSKPLEIEPPEKPRGESWLNEIGMTVAHAPILYGMDLADGSDVTTEAVWPGEGELLDVQMVRAKPAPVTYRWLHVRHANGVTVDWLDWRERGLAEELARENGADIYGITSGGRSVKLPRRKD